MSHLPNLQPPGKIDPQRGFENLLDLRKMNVGLKELSGAFHIPRDWIDFTAPT